MVIVKVGKPTVTERSKPSNCGKRDSHILLLQVTMVTMMEEGTKLPMWHLTTMNCPGAFFFFLFLLVLTIDYIK